MEKYIELCLKLRNLAENGIGGEKFNAKAQLEKLMSKHGITMTMLEDREVSLQQFRVAQKYRALFIQIVQAIMGVKTPVGRVPGTKTLYCINVTKLQKLEIEGKFTFYKRAFAAHFDLFFFAFIVKNELFDKEHKGQEDKLSLEQVKRIKRAMIMAESFDKVTYYPSHLTFTTTTA
jgi:hypothetical protein